MENTDAWEILAGILLIANSQNVHVERRIELIRILLSQREKD